MSPSRIFVGILLVLPTLARAQEPLPSEPPSSASDAHSGGFGQPVLFSSTKLHPEQFGSSSPERGALPIDCHESSLHVPEVIFGECAESRSIPFYFGASLGSVHHTGSVPGTPADVEAWKPGGKVYLGFRLRQRIAAEIDYRWLGKAAFPEANRVTSQERSQAGSASLLVFAPQLLRPSCVHFFGRVGFGIKFVRHRRPTETIRETGISSVLGAGFHIDLTSHLFFRLEYEYVSKIFGATNRAVNAQHTPITAGLGLEF